VNASDEFGYNSITMTMEVGHLDLEYWLLFNTITLKSSIINSVTHHKRIRGGKMMRICSAWSSKSHHIHSSDFCDLDANATDKYRYTPLDYAILHGPVEATKAFRKSTVAGLTTLFLWTHSGQLSTVQLIWEKASIGNPSLGEELHDNQSNAFHLSALHAHTVCLGSSSRSESVELH
jgi:ankyrin repeat protein